MSSMNALIPIPNSRIRIRVSWSSAYMCQLAPRFFWSLFFSIFFFLPTLLPSTGVPASCTVTGPPPAVRHPRGLSVGGALTKVVPVGPPLPAPRTAHGGLDMPGSIGSPPCQFLAPVQGGSPPSDFFHRYPRRTFLPLQDETFSHAHLSTLLTPC